jgi:hypothetical protein
VIRDFIDVNMTADNRPLPPATGFSDAMVLTAVLTDGPWNALVA